MSISMKNNLSYEKYEYLSKQVTYSSGVELESSLLLKTGCRWPQS